MITLLLVELEGGAHDASIVVDDQDALHRTLDTVDRLLDVFGHDKLYNIQIQPRPHNSNNPPTSLIFIYSAHWAGKIKLKKKEQNRMQGNFLFFKSGHYLQNFLLAQIESMQLHSSTQPFYFREASLLGGEIFSKYLDDGLVGHLPFQLYKSPSLKKRSSKKGGARGPYRRYSSEEKLAIIQRMLNGEPLKKIAQKTMIPKRNLIRWKHEYMHQDANPLHSFQMEQNGYEEGQHGNEGKFGHRINRFDQATVILICVKTISTFMGDPIQRGLLHPSNERKAYAQIINFEISVVCLNLARLLLRNHRLPAMRICVCWGFMFLVQDSYSFIISFTRLQSTVMENICLDALHTIQHPAGKPSKAQYQSAASLLVLLHDAHLSLFSSQDKEAPFRPTATLGPIEELQNTRILLLEWLVEHECVLCVGQDGSIFTVSKEGEVDLKAQNEDGISGASLSPTQDYLYVVTHNKTLIQLNMEFDLVSEIPLDEAEEVLPSQPNFSWRADGTHFVINYETVNGHKALTKDQMMNTFISPARSDPKQEGLVQSVSEKGKKSMSGLVSWQPSGSIIAGVDCLIKGQNKQYRIIFWEKNGLRHLQFSLQQNVGQVVELFWSLDSSVLFVKIKTKDGKEQLLMYYRANYHWFLKNTIQLSQGDICLSLSCEKHKKHKLLIIRQADFQIIEYSIRHSQKQWKNLEDEMKCKHQFQYFIDGSTVHLTDLSKCLMPPPMSMLKRTFESNITAFSKANNKMLVISEQRVYLLDLPSNTVELDLQKGELDQKRVFGVRLQSTSPLLFQASNSIYHIVDSRIACKADSKQLQPSYTLRTQEGEIKFAVSYENEQLKVNGNTMSEQCTSFVFYHEFLLFTVSTSSMYDKLFVINLLLDQWIQEENVRTKDKLSDFEARDLLNHRLVERGAKILAISEGRVVLQLPRGNLEGIYPKVIMINQVQKKVAVKQYNAAFEIIRTHKLDFNLLFDLNPDQFFAQIELVLRDIKRTDYINLLVSQVTDGLSSQLQYALSARQLEDTSKDFELKMKGKKIKGICRAVSDTLRKVGKEEYILSIFTSEIKEGRLNEVLFEIKELKQNDVEAVVPPHLTKEAKKGKKKLSSQEILEYVCWLVDANAIYEAALLTYDLQLAAMTARCTQKDPKEYIPYIESLKEIQDQVEFKKKICLDLKRYDVAVKELSLGSPKQKEQSLELIKKHKLFKHGLMIYAGKEELGKVKQLMIQQLLATGETNEAYRVCQSIGQHRRALQIAKGIMDTKKIKESLQLIYSSQEERVKEVTQILNLIKEQTKSRIDLARLFAYIGQYEQAASIYLRHNEYRKAYKYLWNVSEAFREKQMKQGFALCFSVKRNDIIRDKKEFLEKYSRLLKVHKHKSQFGEVASFRPRQNDDMYSEISASSKSQSNYTISTTTGMRKKKDKKRSILTRNVKEGSLLEEEYLLAYIKSLEDKVEDNVKDCKLLIQHLICMNLVEQAETLRNEVRDYIAIFNTYTIKSFARSRFQESHPEAVELYFEQRKLAGLSIDSFNYLF